MKHIIIDSYRNQIDVMKYIRDHQDEANETLCFEFGAMGVLLCFPKPESHADSIAVFIAEHPFSKWEKVDDNMYSYYLGKRAWYAYINNKMYFISD